MLARIMDDETLRAMARLSGVELPDAELEPLRALIERTIEMLARLESLPLSAVDPATQYRML
jgi:Asp-tRNA(Asn)/Glu-tRNA(Gln) amidotransferase C subunit